MSRAQTPAQLRRSAFESGRLAFLIYCLRDANPFKGKNTDLYTAWDKGYMLAKVNYQHHNFAAEIKLSYWLRLPEPQRPTFHSPSRVRPFAAINARQVKTLDSRTDKPRSLSFKRGGTFRVENAR